MKFSETKLSGAFIIDPEPRGDHRGFFARMYCANEFAEHGLATHMVQSNLSRSANQYTLRGMHYQIDGAEEAKLVRCTAGVILDTIIDIRPESPTFKQYVQVELTEDNMRMLYVPPGFAHGFITLRDNCDIFYQVSNFYAPGRERGIRWNDPTFGIEWPSDSPVMSDKDQAYPDFSV